MKKLINDPRNIVREMLEGLVDLAPGQALLEGEAVILRSDLPEPAARPVAIISGGGSGHEPAHAGYVGAGMLSAAVAGDVFTSPSVDAVLAAIRASAGPAGCVLVVKNYTGDRINFGLAAELATLEGIPTEVVVVADDVALAGVVEKSRRRGIAGTVLIHKLAGAAAASGLPVAEVARIAREGATALGSMGVALGACTVPAAGKPGFELGESEIELGLGIHGEKGVERTTIKPADDLTAILVARIVADLGLKSGDRVALLINGLGATPPMELAIVGRKALADLRALGIVVERAWNGVFLSALEMPGVSLSLIGLDDARLALLDAQASAPAWPGPGRIPAARQTVSVPQSALAEEAVPSAGALAGKTRSLLEAVAARLAAAEAELTDLDAKTGDGDLGASMARGAEAIRALPETAWVRPGRSMVAMGGALRRAIAGSSGPFYATALTRAGRLLADAEAPALSAWADAFDEAVMAVATIGGAKPNDRTMLDALEPARLAFRDAIAAGRSGKDALIAAADAAEKGAAATAQMLPRLGRASYLGQRALGTPDGGAVAVSLWLRALAEAL
ncbi:dihydroxyacetone kinase [Devosia enhydra]|uniref:Dihydroxyacetone kinase n=1 Tax=Devosia enhydra TaxID=665118 RepID=A0A1K2HZ93_9HYPH|nr:dihydroxyacetone kinase family protein [Devosia enhydra]SFZ85131.1 dihydroxyacetone kinase [Devosia enhydra]